jgi:hypothetical protein
MSAILKYLCTIGSTFCDFETRSESRVKYLFSKSLFVAQYSVAIKYFPLQHKLVKNPGCHQELLSHIYTQFYHTLGALISGLFISQCAAHNSAIIIIPCNRNFALQEALAEFGVV